MDTKLVNLIFKDIKKNPKILKNYENLFALCYNDREADFDVAHRINKQMRIAVQNALRICAAKDLNSFFDLYKRSLLFDAPYFFDEYMLYLEINRAPKERFYQPRRGTMKVLVDALQDLTDDRLDELFLSMPPRVGKTTILMFYTTWLIGRNSESSNLYCAFSDIITSAFYNGVMEVLTDPFTYTWSEIFPEAKISQTNAKDETINIDRKKRYPSLTCRSLYGTLNGACDCNGVEISDDLIGGIEEALNKDRLMGAWDKVDNNLIPRAKMSAKLLWCGTRWSVIDPAGMRMDLLKNDPRFANKRYKVINLPALNENDESNFNYEYGVGFDTSYFHERRASFERRGDMASWLAQYMGEPIEREGTVFTPSELRYYNGELPDTEPDKIFMAIDPAYGGGDYVSAPVCIEYGNDVYVDDVVFCNLDKTRTQPMIASRILKYKIMSVEMEASKSTEDYKKGVEKQVKDNGSRVLIRTRPAPRNQAKMDRILQYAPDIRENFIFREPGCRTKEYEMFMQNVFALKLVGKTKHDDAPDSLVMAAKMVENDTYKAVATKRPF